MGTELCRICNPNPTTDICRDKLVGECRVVRTVSRRRRGVAGGWALALVGPCGICGAAGVGGSEGGGGVGVVVEPLGRGRAHRCGLVPREVRVGKEAPRGRRGRIARRRRVCGGAEGEEALPALRGLLRFVLAAVHVDSGRSGPGSGPNRSLARCRRGGVVRSPLLLLGRRREFALRKEGADVSTRWKRGERRGQGWADGRLRTEDWSAHQPM